MTDKRRVLKLIARYRAVVTPLLVLLLSGCAGSDGSADKGEHVLWKIQGKKNTVWLLGSVHMLPESAHPFPAAFDEAYNAADRLVFEINMDSDGMMGAAMGLMMKAMIMDGRTLKDLVSPETWALLEPRLDGLAKMFASMAGDASPSPATVKLMKESLMRMKPWFIGMLLQVGDAQEGGEYRPDLGVDLFYAARAREEGKEIGGLETLEEQIGFFESLTGESGEEFLLSSLRQSDPGAEELDRMVDAWKKGDIALLDELVNGSMKDSPETYDLLLVQRNKNWVPQIRKFLESDENYLVIVGAGHLVGKQSVVQLLRNQGYKVERI